MSASSTDPDVLRDATLPTGRLRTFLAVLQAYVVLGASVSFVGWVVGREALADWDGDAIVIMPNACVAAAAAGLAVLALASGRRRIALALGALVAAIGALTLLEYASGLDLGIDRLFLFGRSWGLESVSAPGRMGLPGAVSWTILGAAIVLAASRPAFARARATSAWLATTTTAIATLSLIGYLYGARALFSVPTYTAIALQTASFLLCVSLGVVLAVPERGPMPLFGDPGPSGVLARRLLPAIVVLPILIGTLSVAGMHAHHYGPEFGVALRTVSEIALLILFLWWAAGTIRRQTDKRRTSDAALAERERELNEAQRVSQVGSWRWDAATDGTFVSQEVRRIFALAPDEPFPRSDEQEGRLYPRDSWARLEAVVRASVASGEPFEVEIEALRGSERFWVEIRGEVVRDEAGNLSTVRGTIQDITARLRAEADRRKQAHVLRSVTEHAQVGLVILDREYRYVYANPSYAALVGLESQDLVGRNASDVLGAGFTDEIRSRLETAFAGERAYLEHALPPATPGSSPRWFAVSYEPHPDDDGVVRSIVVAVVDVTVRKEFEAARESLYQREREARREAERAVRIKDEFLATLSHELRTPLNAVLGWAQILRIDAWDPEKGRRAAAVIERNGRMQAQLITDLLDISRITSGKMRLELQPVDLAAVIGAAVDSMMPAARAKEITLERDLATIGASVRGDPGRLQQVVWNLLSNAVKFTARGGRVRVELARVDSGAAIRVVDDGQGIEPEFLPHLFERFRQADASTSRTHGGLGIGLALVKQIVEMHGGRVEASSAGAGRGATFVVELPLVRTVTSDEFAPPSLAGARPGPAPVEAPAGQLHGITALVVDDEVDAVDVLQRVLRSYGAQVVTALSAEEALERIEQRIFDVVVSDIGMPGGDGYELMRALRARNVTTPAVALTAFARAEDREHAAASGFQAHLAKPVEVSELVRTIARLVGSGTDSRV